MSKDYASDDGEVFNDVEAMRVDYEAEGMTLWWKMLDRGHYDSAHDGNRCFIVIFDVHPSIMAPYRSSFCNLLRAMMSHERLAVDTFLIDDDLLAQLTRGGCRRDAKKQKEDPGWKDIHEAGFQHLSLPWPPVLAPGLGEFREREAELIMAAHTMFPPSLPVAPELCRVDCFDTNITWEWTFGWPMPEVVKSPWRTTIPCMTSLSSIVIRRVTPDGKVVLRRLHGIEAMRFQGWDLGFWLDTEWQKVGDVVCASPWPQWLVKHFAELDIQLAPLPIVFWRMLQDASLSVTVCGDEASHPQFQIENVSAKIIALTQPADRTVVKTSTLALMDAYTPQRDNVKHDAFKQQVDDLEVVLREAWGASCGTDVVQRTAALARALTKVGVHEVLLALRTYATGRYILDAAQAQHNTLNRRCVALADVAKHSWRPS